LRPTPVTSRWRRVAVTLADARSYVAALANQHEPRRHHRPTYTSSWNSTEPTETTHPTAGHASRISAPSQAQSDHRDRRARRGAHNVRIFGSVARGQDEPDSDIDFLVDLDKGVGLVKLAGLEGELSESLARRVDVVLAEGLKPRVRSKAERDLVQL